MLAATPFALLYAQWRNWQLNMQRPAETQERELLSLVRRAASTRFGRDHHFASIRSVEEFQDRVPIRTYEDLWNGYWKTEFPELNDCTWPGTIPYFALTAGTTTGVDQVHSLLARNARCQFPCRPGYPLSPFAQSAHEPNSRPQGFILGGSTDLREGLPGIYSGDLERYRSQ